MLKRKDEKFVEINTMQGLLGDPETKKIVDLAKYLAPQGKLIEREQKYGEYLEKDKLTKEYGLDIFSMREVVEECYKYNLAIIPARNYKGDFDLKFLRKMDETIEASNLNAVSKQYRDELYFVGRRKADVEGCSEIEGDKINMAFFKIPGRPYYALLNRNDEHVNLFNAYMGVRYRKPWTHRMLFTGEVYFTLMILLTFFNSAFFNMNAGYYILSVLFVGISFLITSIVMSKYESNHSYEQCKHDHNYFLTYYKRKGLC